jgi:hypothetical protein
MSSSRERSDVANPHPQWVTQFRQFYRQFPETVRRAYRTTRVRAGETEDPEGCPQVWKTIGDEILFCCRVNSVQHLACCVQAFLLALEQYGSQLDGNVPLDVKGAGWLSAFPAENISIEVLSAGVISEYDEDDPQEDFEDRADRDPSKFDFLGTGIDTGFRIAKNATSDRFTASVGLALHLCDAAAHQMFSGTFEYHGREKFKGGNRDQPYPVVTIVSERDHTKRELRERERLVFRQESASPTALYDFLKVFMRHERIDAPMLPLKEDDPQPHPPATYQRYLEGLRSQRKEVAERDKEMETAAAIPEENGQPLPSVVRVFLKKEAALVSTADKDNSPSKDDG